ncbi:MAG: 4-hydroxythreonine-4-phosphate dehydrogenase PdxA [Terrisporobacter othiniensis]|uniref:4-hydroxythreonine-4-phosphate dehydrogenase PdxA n=1 Tax=Terrisporobacter petrolearius TaxID=1460447 RepID=UPI0022E22DB0|nr:4-hydroxythreonine-4-phosphate dehydrogenase PdxA [Terrisporobacter petrolearius]MDU4862026.1 4-hydroxythreonine-4-phosphate dehydrogenase PdxA [Terrisporobacter othiniensis]MDU6995662.1 4-hydroxythreonine-4-phosphate dehydrogenase PdxA [Terrisporobacter othiniensis]
MNREYIGVPLGDPAGIGPEIVVKSIAKEETNTYANIVVFGNKEILEKAIAVCEVDMKINTIENPQDGDYNNKTLNLVNIDNIDMNKFEPGKVSGMCGKAAFEYLAKSIDYAMEGKVKAIATTPLNKESFKAGNVPYIGHTEVLEDLTKTYNPLTMFQVRDLRVFFLSRHVSLKKACDLVTEENMYEFIIRSKEALRQLGIENPKMAVAGLNPHCGEHGLFGDEEREIEPAIERARKEGIDVAGPIGADSVFFFGLQGKFDAVLSLYHDQGHIATKTVDFHRTISITNNMPFLRTSVDHGTAFDIAWKNIANEISLVEAIRLAGDYASNFNKM